MSRPVTPENLVERIARLEREIEELRRSRTNSFQGMTFQDDQGRVRVRIGKIPAGGYGVIVYNAAGSATFTQTNA